MVAAFKSGWIKPGWSKPSTILFASEFPANDKTYSFALAQAAEFGADLMIFHADDSPDTSLAASPRAPAFKVAAIHGSSLAASRPGKRLLEDLAQRAKTLGIHCKTVIRPGQAADQILTCLRERKIDRVVMGAHAPGHFGKLLVGSVAEAVLRAATVPVCIVGPNVVEDTYRNSFTRKILCDVSKQEAGRVVANFGAELASRYNASLILQQVIPPQERADVLAGRTINQVEAELPSLLPAELQHKVEVRTSVALGDPAEELLYQGRVQNASLIVLGAQGASRFAALTRAGAVYKVLAYAQCPVVTLSPVVLAECGAGKDHSRQSEVNYLAGVF
jgi:nucleotide-binding universal stress UspA family protein